MYLYLLIPWVIPISFVFTNGPIVRRLNDWDYDCQCQMGAGNKTPGLTGWDGWKVKYNSPTGDKIFTAKSI